MPIEKSCESVSRYVFSYREKESPAASSFKFRCILRFPPELLLWKYSKRRRTDALSLNECPLIFKSEIRVVPRDYEIVASSLQETGRTGLFLHCISIIGPVDQFWFASNEQKFVLVRDFGNCCENEWNSRSVFYSLPCIRPKQIEKENCHEQ